MLLETRGFPADHPFHNVRAQPAEVALPPIFLLGSSDYSAQLAGQIGAAFSFAHHFANFDAEEAMRLYRDSFRPSPAHARPYAILATHVVCADTDAEAEHLAATVDLNFVRRAKGEYQPLASPQDALAYDYAPADRARIKANRARMSVGAPATIKPRLDALLAATKADELMVTSMIFDHAARKRSYELLAQAFELTAG
jgi:luciferase family oxidoreductase group 1